MDWDQQEQYGIINFMDWTYYFCRFYVEAKERLIVDNGKREYIFSECASYIWPGMALF